MEKQNNKNGKLMDEAFTRLVVMSLLAVCICIVCLCSTTFAWFSDSVPSNGNEIKMADKCLLTVKVTKEVVESVSGEDGAENGVEPENGEGSVSVGDAEQGVDPENANDGAEAENTKVTVELENIEDGVELEAGVPYTVTLELPANSASGYCLISAGENKYYTDYIANHKDSEPHKFSFTLIVETTQMVKFTPRWGIYSRESDVVNSTLTIP